MKNVPMQTVKTAAREMGISKHNLIKACQSGLVKDAYHNDVVHTWYVPRPVTLHYQAASQHV